MKKFNIVILALVSMFLLNCEKKAENSTSNSKEIKSVENSAKNPVPETEGNLTANTGNLTASGSDLHKEINLSADYLFDFDKAVLKPEADKELSEAAEIINKEGSETIYVTGYTDAKGSAAYNQKLSLDRANAVKTWFIDHGVQKNIDITGKGAEDPVAPNVTADGKDNPEGRAKNRRVVIFLNKDENLSK